jgi:hypothetical protein
MSSFQKRLAAVTDMRLAVVIDAAANLNIQLRELNRLREQVRRAQLSARISRRIDHKKEHAFRIKRI